MQGAGFRGHQDLRKLFVVRGSNRVGAYYGVEPRRRESGFCLSLGRRVGGVTAAVVEAVYTSNVSPYQHWRGYGFLCPINQVALTTMHINLDLFLTVCQTILPF